MSTNDLLMSSFSMKRSQNCLLVDTSCTDFTTLLPQQHHDTPKFDVLHWRTASIALNSAHNSTNFPTTLLRSRTFSTFPCIFLQPNLDFVLRNARNQHWSREHVCIDSEYNHWIQRVVHTMDNVDVEGEECGIVQSCSR
jgi:hypothetical protein